MKYENGKEYTFKFGNVTVLATFEGLTDKVADRFNRLCAEEMARAYHGKGTKTNDGKGTYAGAY